MAPPNPSNLMIQQGLARLDIQKPKVSANLFQDYSDYMSLKGLVDRNEMHLNIFRRNLRFRHRVMEFCRKYEGR